MFCTFRDVSLYGVFCFASRLRCGIIYVDDAEHEAMSVNNVNMCLTFQTRIIFTIRGFRFSPDCIIDFCSTKSINDAFVTLQLLSKLIESFEIDRMYFVVELLSNNTEDGNFIYRICFRAN